MECNRAQFFLARENSLSPTRRQPLRLDGKDLSWLSATWLEGYHPQSPLLKRFSL